MTGMMPGSYPGIGLPSGVGGTGSIPAFSIPGVPTASTALNPVSGGLGSSQFGNVGSCVDTQSDCASYRQYCTVKVGGWGSDVKVIDFFVI